MANIKLQNEHGKSVEAVPVMLKVAGKTIRFGIQSSGNRKILVHISSGKVIGNLGGILRQKDFPKDISGRERALVVLDRFSTKHGPNVFNILSIMAA